MKAKCLDCGNINEVKVSTGHKKPENKGKLYFECINCKKYHWDSDVKPMETNKVEQQSTSMETREPLPQPIFIDQRSYRIERQHSQDMAIRFLELAIKIRPEEFIEIKDLKGLVKKYTDHFQSDLTFSDQASKG